MNFKIYNQTMDEVKTDYNTGKLKLEFYAKSFEYELDKGFKSYNSKDMYGNQWKKCFVDDYNKLTCNILQKMISYKNSKKMNESVEFWLDARHKHYVMISELYREI